MFGFSQPVSYKIFGKFYSVLSPMAEEITKGLSKLSNEETHNLSYSLNSITVIETVRKISGRVARRGEMRNVYRILVKELRELIGLEQINEHRRRILNWVLNGI